MRQEEGETILTTHTQILCIVTFLKNQILNLQENRTSFYSRRGLKMKRKNSNQGYSNSAPTSSHMRSVTCFPILAPPKTTSTPTLYATWKVRFVFVH